jgi:hypothetical protein
MEEVMIRVTILTLSTAFAFGAFSAEIFAQGRGQGVGAASNRPATAGANSAATAGVSRRPDFATARSEGALRGIGRDNTPGATGGIGRTTPAVGAQLNAGSAGAASDKGRGTVGRAKGQAFRESRGLSLHARARQQMANRIRDRRSDIAATTDDSAAATLPDAVTALRRSPWERDGISRADWLLAKRLASIDKLRDKALEIGNDRMLDQADKLEALARHQHERRTGEFADPEPQDPTPQDPLADDAAPQDPTTTVDDGSDLDPGAIPSDEPTAELSGDILPVSDETTEPAPPAAE